MTVSTFRAYQENFVNACAERTEVFLGLKMSQPTGVRIDTLQQDIEHTAAYSCSMFIIEGRSCRVRHCTQFDSVTRRPTIIFLEEITEVGSTKPFRRFTLKQRKGAWVVVAVWVSASADYWPTYS